MKRAHLAPPHTPYGCDRRKGLRSVGQLHQTKPCPDSILSRSLHQNKQGMKKAHPQCHSELAEESHPVGVNTKPGYDSSVLRASRNSGRFLPLREPAWPRFHGRPFVLELV